MELIAEDLFGNKFWYLNGRYHRLNGPAIEYKDGHFSWYLFGIKYNFTEFLANSHATPAEETMLRLTYL
jgi:hypothetical protein